jgi:hypothetical protein
MEYRPKDHWGPSLWKFIHTICIIDFENNEPYVTQIISNLKSLGPVIPCHKCQALYEDHLKKLDTIDRSESMVLFKWSWELHNAVNIKHNKPEMTYEDALREYTRE